MVIPIDPCETCGGDPAFCDCGEKYFPRRDEYEAIIHGAPSKQDHHCDLCGAVDRYCPGHLRDVELLHTRGGVKRMMPVASGMVVREQWEGRRADDEFRGSVGYFIGDPVAFWTPDGERMILDKEFAYVDQKSRRWGAPRGAILEGASVPRAIWPLVGTPYRGKYRYASIIHEYYCKQRVESWESVHACFYHACLAAGTGSALAKLLYFAVYHFGPKWGYRSRSGYVPISRGRAPELPMAKVEAIERYIVGDDPTLDEIRAIQPGSLGVTFRNSS